MYNNCCMQYITVVVLLIFVNLTFCLECCVCEQVLPARSAHRCLKCGLGVHAICGQNPDGDEGYGVEINCIS